MTTAERGRLYFCDVVIYLVLDKTTSRLLTAVSFFTGGTDMFIVRLILPILIFFFHIVVACATDLL